MMKVQREIMSLFLVLIVYVFVAKSSEAQMVSFVINCGTNSTVNVDGRRWIGDSSSESNVTLSSPCDEASTTTFNGDPPYAPLYKTACVFTDPLNYTFRATHGSYFLRLHFHPFSFRRYNANASYFSVEANGVELVSEFNVLGEILNKNTDSTYLVKEYFFSIDASIIVVSFVPSRGSYGFINAIEIVQEGNEMFVDLVRRVGSKGGGDTSLNLSEGGIETMYRLNVGGSFIRPSQDSPFWRFWEDDSSYMINSDAGLEIGNISDITYANNTKLAPYLVYETARTLSNTTGMTEKRFNMSWKLEVDPDFDYLVRLHFCEPGFEKANQRIFRIYIDNKTAAHNFDIYVRAGGVHRAYHEDYLDSVSSNSKHIWVQLGPETISGSAGTDALLNGLEVFKLSRNNSLAYVQKYSNLEIKKTSRLNLWVGIGVGVGCIAILAAVIFVFVRFLKKRDVHDTKKVLFLHANSKGSSQFDRRFTLSEIKEATNGFDGSLVIGEGGFGKVFKGEINEGTLVAIKRSDPQSHQGLAEFKTEIEMLSKLRHRHLVSLIGFCDEQSELVLVYEHMAKGTLRSHLYGSDLPPLSWKQRVEVCIGAARGLHYLHTGLDRAIIHRDVKTTNILLDENLVAKVSDFGLSKTGPSLEHTHVSTAVKGSFGYLDPEYFRSQHLTDKSDVYSFGVVLFEVVCARAVINPALPKDQISLAEWALRMQRERLLVSVADPALEGRYCPQSLIVFGDIAERCCCDEGKRRPTMGEVLWHLEHVLRLHDTWLSRNEEDGVVLIDKVAFETVTGPQETAREDGELGFKIANGVDPFDPMAVGIDEFSQMIDLRGR